MSHGGGGAGSEVGLGWLRVAGREVVRGTAVVAEEPGFADEPLSLKYMSSACP